MSPKPIMQQKTTMVAVALQEYAEGRANDRIKYIANSIGIDLILMGKNYGAGRAYSETMRDSSYIDLIMMVCDWDTYWDALDRIEDSKLTDIRESCVDTVNYVLNTEKVGHQGLVEDLYRAIEMSTMPTYTTAKMFAYSMPDSKDCFMANTIARYLVTLNEKYDILTEGKMVKP